MVIILLLILLATAHSSSCPWELTDLLHPITLPPHPILGGDVPVVWQPHTLYPCYRYSTRVNMKERSPDDIVAKAKKESEKYAPEKELERYESISDLLSLSEEELSNFGFTPELTRPPTKNQRKQKLQASSSEQVSDMSTIQATDSIKPKPEYNSDLSSLSEHVLDASSPKEHDSIKLKPTLPYSLQIPVGGGEMKERIAGGGEQQPSAVPDIFALQAADSIQSKPVYNPDPSSLSEEVPDTYSHKDPGPISVAETKESIVDADEQQPSEVPDTFTLQTADSIHSKPVYNSDPSSLSEKVPDTCSPKGSDCKDPDSIRLNPDSPRSSQISFDEAETEQGITGAGDHQPNEGRAKDVDDNIVRSERPVGPTARKVPVPVGVQHYHQAGVVGTGEQQPKEGRAQRVGENIVQSERPTEPIVRMVPGPVDVQHYHYAGVVGAGEQQLSEGRAQRISENIVQSERSIEPIVWMMPMPIVQHCQHYHQESLPEQGLIRHPNGHCCNHATCEHQRGAIFQNEIRPCCASGVPPSNLYRPTSTYMSMDATSQPYQSSRDRRAHGYRISDRPYQNARCVSYRMEPVVFDPNSMHSTSARPNEIAYDFVQSDSARFTDYDSAQVESGRFSDLAYDPYPSSRSVAYVSNQQHAESQAASVFLSDSLPEIRLAARHPSDIKYRQKTVYPTTASGVFGSAGLGPTVVATSRQHTTSVPRAAQSDRLELANGSGRTISASIPVVRPEVAPSVASSGDPRPSSSGTSGAVVRDEKKSKNRLRNWMSVHKSKAGKSGK